MPERFVFKDKYGGRYRVKAREADRVLKELEEGLNRGEGGGQPNLILGCFKSIDYDLERCKSCGFYEWKCKLVLEGFIEREDLSGGFWG